MEQYTIAPTEQYIIAPMEQYIIAPIEQYIIGSIEQYIIAPIEQYIIASIEQYIVAPTEQYIHSPERVSHNRLSLEWVIIESHRCNLHNDLLTLVTLHLLPAHSQQAPRAESGLFWRRTINDSPLVTEIQDQMNCIPFCFQIEGVMGTRLSQGRDSMV